MKQVKKTIYDLVAKGDNAYNVPDLALIIYGVDEVEKKHSVAILRAMKQVANDNVEFEVRGAYEKGRPRIIYKCTSPKACGKFSRKSRGNRKGIKPEEIKEGGKYFNISERNKIKVFGTDEEKADLKMQTGKELASLFGQLQGELLPQEKLERAAFSLKEALELLLETEQSFRFEDGRVLTVSLTAPPPQ